MVKFLRRIYKNYSKLGRGRKKKQIWKMPKGRDNKMREKRRGYPATVSIGYKQPKKEEPVIIFNPRELEKINKDSKILIGNVGKKKKIEIAKKAKEMKLKIINLNPKSFLKQNKLKEKKKEEAKK